MNPLEVLVEYVTRNGMALCVMPEQGGVTVSRLDGDGIAHGAVSAASHEEAYENLAAHVLRGDVAPLVAPDVVPLEWAS